MAFISSGDVARRFGVKARVVADLFYQGRLDTSVCPVIAGRRLIPSSYVVEIGRVLEEFGFIPEGQAVAAV